MLSVMYGVSMMIPIIFGISGYLLVSRDAANPQRHASAPTLKSERDENHD
jgi:hypothetical protein